MSSLEVKVSPLDPNSTLLRIKAKRKKELEQWQKSKEAEILRSIVASIKPHWTEVILNAKTLS